MSETIQECAPEVKIKIICSLRYCKLPTTPLEFQTSNAHLIQGGEYLESSIFNEYVLKQIGNINIGEFVNNPYFVSFLTIGNPKELATITVRLFSALNHFISFLWFARDNCIDLGVMYSYFSEVDDVVLTRYKHSNTSMANGEYSTIELTLADLTLAEKVADRIRELQNNKKESKNSPSLEVNFSKPIIADTTYHYRDYNEHNRIQRAFSFLHMARSNSFLPLKISLYIAMLETIFTTDSTEVNYKVCQRVAFYLGGDFETKFTTFQKIKEAYDIRSKFFHGQELKKKKDSRDNLARVSMEADNIVRQILTKVIFEDSELFLNDEASLNEYYNKLVFT